MTWTAKERFTAILADRGVVRENRERIVQVLVDAHQIMLDQALSFTKTRRSEVEECLRIEQRRAERAEQQRDELDRIGREQFDKWGAAEHKLRRYEERVNILEKERDDAIKRSERAREETRNWMRGHDRQKVRAQHMQRERDMYYEELVRLRATLARVRELRPQTFKAPGHVKESEWINLSDLRRVLEGDVK